MNYLPPGGDPIKLSAKEAGDLYTLSNLMQLDPIRARAEMDKVSDKVRAVAAQAFTAQSQGVTANNQATRFANADANDAARTDLMGQELGLKRELNAAHIGAYNRSGRSPIEALTAEAERLVKAGTFKDVPTAIEVLKKGSVKPEYTPKAYAETVKLYAEAGFPLEDARMMADKDYGRGAATSSDERLQQRNTTVATRQRPIEVRPGEVIARDPNTKIRGPVDQFVRESTRLPMWKGGGLSYGYRDPVTNQTYTIDEYNKLLSE